jgi:putative transposase
VIFLVVYMLAGWLLACLMVRGRREASKDAELLALRHENAVLRRQVGRVRLPAGRPAVVRCAVPADPPASLGRGIRRDPATLLAWHRRLVAGKWDHASRRRPGRPSTAAAICKLVIHMATHAGFMGRTARPGTPPRTPAPPLGPRPGRRRPGMQPGTCSRR